MTQANGEQTVSKRAVSSGFASTLDNGTTLTNERTDITDELTNDLQDQGSNRLVPNAPTPVDKSDLVEAIRSLRTIGGLYDVIADCVEWDHREVLA